VVKRFLVFLPLVALASVVTYYHANLDSGVTSGNTLESVLTPSNVVNLRKLGAYSTDGYTFGQPLYAPGVTISGVSRNLVIQATLANTVYAFDADVPGSSPIWSHNLGTPRATYPNNSGANTFAYGKPLGIVSTPAIDPGNNTLFVVSQSSVPAYTLFKLNLSTGATISSVVISGHVLGTGDPVGGDDVTPPNLNFNAGFEYVQRPGLVISQGRVYVAFGGTDLDPYHGWLFAYNTSNLSQAGIFCDTPNGAGGSIWQSGGAPSVDAAGNIYVTTGNGDYDGTSNYGETVLKLSPTLTVLDHFTPANWPTLNSDDSDVSSSRFILIPGTTQGVIAAKDFNVYLLSTGCMGGLQGSGSGCPLQTFKSFSSGVAGDSSGSYGGMFLNNALFLPTTTSDVGATVGSMYKFGFSAGSFNTTALASNVNTWSFPGAAQMTGSSNGASSGLVWITTGASSSFAAVQPGTLRALDAGTLAELWNSGSALGTLAKFAAPTVANGKVFVATQDSQLAVFGLLSTSGLRGFATMRGSATLR
jgi:hypothetical protein